MKIIVENLVKKFKKEQVLNIEKVEFKSGHIYGIFGRNGSGKSVFLKTLCGFYKPSEGNILIDNINYHKKNEIPQNMRCLFDSNCFYGDLSGLKNLQLLANINKIISDEEIQKFLNVVLLDEPNKRFSKYSIGNKQKVGICQAIMENPDLLILDEPYNGVDRKSVKSINSYLLQKKKEGKLIIISSHIKDDLLDICDNYLFMENGNITEVDDFNDL